MFLMLFFFGLFGIFYNRKSILLVLLSVELMLLSVNFSLLALSSYVDDRFGQVLAIFVLTVAAAESAIGLSILFVYYRLQWTLSLEQITSLKG
jgi:NADH-quinone oxidoreductase subunit K